MPSDYIPANLVTPNVEFSFKENIEKRHLRTDAATTLEHLFADAKENNITLVGVSGYRSYERQVTVFMNNVKSHGFEAANQVSAYPGQSEHQTGLAIDVSSADVNYDLTEDFGISTEGQWLANNAHEHGFIIRYLKGKEKITGYSYEPWHIRYVGVKTATQIFKNHWTLEEYLSNQKSKKS